MRCAFLIIVAGCLGCAKTAAPSAAQPTLKEWPPDALGIAEPIEVREIVYFNDGGTAAVILKDATEKEFRACLDGEPFVHFDKLYIGARHPKDSGARPVEIGGEEEAALYGVLARWLDRVTGETHQFASDKEEAWHYWRLDGVKVFLHELAERQKKPGSVSNKKGP